jgi:4-hydroxy-tetrahydrodipicolinate synthase
MVEDIKNVIGVKQWYGGVSALYEMVQVCGKSVPVYSAADEMLCTTYELGAAGAISAVITMFPDICVEMWREYHAGNLQRALEIQGRVFPVWSKIVGNQFPIRAKYALKLMGRDLGHTRCPITHISDEEKTKIGDALRCNGFTV